MEHEEEGHARCARCGRTLGYGIDAVSVQQGVMGPRGFVPVEGARCFCDEECIAKDAKPTLKVKRRIP